VTRLLHKDRIAASISLVFSLLIAQKIIAFGRGIIFARLLGTEQYGIFTLGFFFVLITVSIAGLGITASFARYSPRYQGMGALRWFIRKAYVLNISLAGVVGIIVFLFPSVFSRLLYDEPGQTAVVAAAALAIPGMVVVRNLVTTFAGLKLFRASSVLEFSQVVIFALLGGLLVVLYRSASVGLLAYAISMILCIPLFAPLLAGYLRTQEPVYKEADDMGFYKRLLLSAVGLAVSSVIYPHLSAAWEGGKRDSALKDLDLSIRVTSVGLLAIGLALVLLAKPIIILLLGQDYIAGAQVLPWIVVFHILTISLWLFGVYPTLVERTYVSAIGLVCALPVNVGLNILLIPRLGIVGAAVATVVSYLVMWFITVRICAAYGMPVKRRTVIVSFLPFALLLPKLLAFAAVGLVIYICATKTWIVTGDERRRVYADLAAFIKRRGRSSDPPKPDPT
jgi:O-antigen/teichoic acid export membrane protein